MANGTIAFDTLSTSGQITGTAKSVDTDYVVNGSAKVWVSFDGTGTIAIKDSFNTTSITDDSTGNYTITIDNNMGNANYVAQAGGDQSGGATSTCITAGVITDGSHAIACRQNGTSIDIAIVNSSIHGDLA